jgi:hypothetical protein
MRMRTVVPLPGALMTSDVPPWVATMEATIASPRPRPEPPDSRFRLESPRQNRSKT